MQPIILDAHPKTGWTLFGRVRTMADGGSPRTSIGRGPIAEDEPEEPTPVNPEECAEHKARLEALKRLELIALEMLMKQEPGSILYRDQASLLNKIMRAIRQEEAEVRCWCYNIDCPLV